MSSFANYPILITESMNPFIVSVAFKCDKCGKISKTLEHDCLCEGQTIILRESFLLKLKRFFSVPKIPVKMEE